MEQSDVHGFNKKFVYLFKIYCIKKTNYICHLVKTMFKNILIILFFFS